MSVSLIENLTGKRWNASAAGISELGLDGVVTFANFEYGLYTLINEGANDVAVALWGQIYKVASNSRWDFMAHPEVRSISPLVATAGIERFRGDAIQIADPIDPPWQPGDGKPPWVGGPEQQPAGGGGEATPEPTTVGGTDTTTTA